MAYLRLTAGRHPTDGRLANLIGELAMRSETFSELRAAGDVADCTTGDMLLRHPVAGRLDVGYQVWLQPDSPDHRLEIYTPMNAASADALRLLSSVTRTDRAAASTSRSAPAASLRGSSPSPPGGRTG